MPDLLFEIGTEELPHSAVASGEEQLGEATRKLLQDARITHGTAETFATARRLAVLVRDLVEAQAPAVEERRGPPVAQGFLEDGTHAPAAVGFARANQTDPAALVRRETPTGEYLFVVKEIPGSPTQDVLPDLLRRVVEALQFPKAMRWDASKVRFPRAIRWLVALHGDDVVPVELGTLVAGRASRGHRVAGGTVEIANPAAYERTLEGAGVIPRRVKRRHLVRTAAEDGAKQLGGTALVHESVLDEVTDLVERPSTVVGRFENDYLKLPRDVLVTVMESHQRYFPVEDDAGNLLAGFVVVSNAEPAAASTIGTGNERVLRARLEDARFFFEEDLKVPLSERTAGLVGVVLHPKLGTLRDKVLRVGVLLGKVVQFVGLSDEEADVAFAAADVSKADRTTHLVFEFPELQGSMGREYALVDSELRDQVGDLLPKVADTIRDHYLPRVADDPLPESLPAVALGIADRLDTLVGYLGIGVSPSSSQDPFALRREAYGLAAVSIGKDAPIPLEDAVRAAHEQYTRGGVELAPVDEVARQVTDLVLARAEALFAREGIDRMLVEAARASDWTDLPDLASRARGLQRLREQGVLHNLAVAFERCNNLSKGGPHGEVDEGALLHEAEQNLYGQLVAVEEIARERAATRDYATALQTLVPLSEVVDAFMDPERGVLVMHESPEIRRNRQALLARTADVYKLVADFALIIPKQLE